MDTNQMFSLMDILILGAGAYLLFSWYQLMFRDKINEGVLLPKVEGIHCNDFPGFKKFIGTKLLVVSVSSMLCGGIGLYSDYVNSIGAITYLALTFLFFAVLIWFAVKLKKAHKIYFDL